MQAHGRGCEPVLRQRLADAWAGLRIMELNNDRLLTTVLRGGHPGPESSIGKLLLGELAPATSAS